MYRKMCSTLPDHQKVVKNMAKGACGVFLGGMAMDAVAMSVGALHPETYPRIYRFGKRNWICDVKPQFLQNKWGQPIDYTPFPIFQIAKELYPDYSDNEPMTFEMMGAIITKHRERMRELGIQVFDKNVVGMDEDSKNGDLVVHMEGGEDVRIPSGGNHYVVNAARQVKLPGGIPEDVRQCIQSTDNLYTQASSATESKSKAGREKIMIFGGGRNLDWALMHFPEADIIHIIPKGDRVREDLDKPEYEGRLRHVMLDEVKLRVNKKDSEVYIVGQDTKGEGFGLSVPKTNCYSAMGTEFNAELTEKLPKDKVAEVDTVKSPEMQIEGGLVQPNKSVVKVEKAADSEKHVEDRVVPEYKSKLLAARKRIDLRDTLMPLGSLTTNYFAIMNKLGLSFFKDRQSIVNFNKWMDDVYSCMLVKGLIKNPHDPASEKVIAEFFEKLGVLVMDFYERPNFGEKRFPSEENVQAMVQIIARKTLGGEDLQGFFNMKPEAFFAEFYGKGPLLLGP